MTKKNRLISSLHFFFRIAAMISAMSLLFSACSTPRSSAATVFHSKIVNDNFELYVDLPEGYSKDSSYSLVFYLDANLKMGQEIRLQAKLKENRKHINHVIFIGVGHIGNYRTLRRRDFIPAIVKGDDIEPSKDPDYGHAEDFYSFLTQELIPFADQQYPNNGRYSIIGHSLSGLFAFYCLLQPEPVFTTYIALSPSLWIDNHNFFARERLFSEKQAVTWIRTLYHSCGSREWINKVLYSSRRMKGVLETGRYLSLEYFYREHEGKGHNAVVPVSLEYVLKELAL